MTKLPTSASIETARIKGLIEARENIYENVGSLTTQDLERANDAFNRGIIDAVEKAYRALSVECNTTQSDPGDEQPEKVNVELNVDGKTVTVDALMTDSALDALRSFKNDVNKSDIQEGDILEYGHNQWSVISRSQTRDVYGNIDEFVQLQVQLLTGPIHAVECIWLHELDTHNLIIHKKKK